MTNPLYDTLFGQHQGKTTAFLELADGTNVSHNDYLELAAQYAHVFTQLGVKPGDRVAVQIGKSPQALAVYAACVQAGIVFLPLNTAYTPDEVSYFVENSGARVLLCDGKRSEALEPVSQATGAILETMNNDGSGSFAMQAEAMP